jgi:predicted nicotinamide N-methyase
LWKASHHLNDYILQHYHKWRGLRILELGAGLGFCGILVHRLLSSTAASSSASNSSSTVLCLTDGDTEALPVLRENLRRSGANSPSELAADPPPVRTTCRQLLWGRDTAQRFADTQRGLEAYDVILASDIIYAPQILVPLWETIQVLLSSSDRNEVDPVFVLAFAKRKVPVQVNDVLQTATDFGFVYTCISATKTNNKTDKAEATKGEKEEEEEVFLYEFRPKTRIGRES